MTEAEGQDSRPASAPQDSIRVGFYFIFLFRQSTRALENSSSSGRAGGRGNDGKKNQVQRLEYLLLQTHRERPTGNTRFESQ